ncbi:hypothetical protein PybrP1_012147 [[Pythium] brassicae (nom. inval.)]|nr:hypothetical protein PybrP1_012147 [[Pythium] brassicae (nom. inval.)]
MEELPVAWQGMFQDRSGRRSMVMEAVATQNLWIWHSYVGLAGSNNDTNIVDRSPLLHNWIRGHATSSAYTVNGSEYKSCYLLCDNIYPSWSTFVKAIGSPHTDEGKWFLRQQEAAKKDVERCFGVLRSRFAILAQPGRFWDHAMLRAVWSAAVIMHNMIVEDDEHHYDGDEAPDHNQTHEDEPPRVLTVNELVEAMANVQDETAHSALRADLVAHLWSLKSNE